MKKKKELKLVSKLEIIKLDEAEAAVTRFEKEEVCPDCGAALPPPVGHCFTCIVCGWSKCSL